MRRLFPRMLPEMLAGMLKLTIKMSVKMSIQILVVGISLLTSQIKAEYIATPLASKPLINNYNLHSYLRWIQNTNIPEENLGNQFGATIRTKPIFQIDNTFITHFLEAYNSESIAPFFQIDFYTSIFSHILNAIDITKYISGQNNNILNFHYISNNGVSASMNIDLQTNILQANNINLNQIMENQLNASSFYNLIDNIDILQTLQFYSNQIQHNTINLMENRQFTVYRAIAPMSSKEKYIAYKALVNKNLQTKYQKDHLHEERIIEKITSDQAEEIYWDIVNQKSYNQHLNIIGVELTHNNHTCLAFNLKTVLAEIIGILTPNNDSIKTFQKFTVNLIKSSLNMNLANIWKVNDHLRHLLHAIPHINNILSGEKTSLNQEDINTHCLLLPDFSKINHALGNETDPYRLTELILDAYNIHSPSAQTIRSFLNFLIKYNRWQKHAAHHSFGIHAGTTGGRNQTTYHKELSIKGRQLEQYFVAIPNDYQKAIDYTCFSQDVPLNQKITALGIMGAITHDQLIAIQYFHHGDVLSKGFDYRHLNNDDIENNTAILPELDNKTIKDFVEDLCENPDQTYLPHLNNISLWLLWKNLLKEHYYSLQNNIQYTGSYILSNHEILKIFFNTDRVNTVTNYLPNGMEIALIISV